MRFNSLQARATTLEKVVADARELLLARAEQIREYDRRMADVAAERNALQERVSSLQASLIEAQSQFKEADMTRSAYMERNETLARAFTAKDAALKQVEDANASLTDRVARWKRRVPAKQTDRAQDRGPRGHLAPRENGACGGGRRAENRPAGTIPRRCAR